MSSVPVSPCKETLAVVGVTPRRRWFYLALSYVACGLILAACALGWIAMLVPYRMPPEMIRAYEREAVSAAQAKGLVWVNTQSGIYHKPGSRWYGNTSQGKYTREWIARLEGNEAAKNGQ